MQLNPAKTEVLWCATSRRRHQLPTTAMLIDGVPVTQVENVRDLGIYIDGDHACRRTFSERLRAVSLLSASTSDPSIGTNGHIPDADGRPCRPTAGLQE